MNTTDKTSVTGRRRAGSVIQNPNLVVTNLTVRERIELWKAREGKSKDQRLVANSKSSEQFRAPQKKSAFVIPTVKPEDATAPSTATDETAAKPKDDPPVVEPKKPKFPLEGIKLSVIDDFIAKNGGLEKFQGLSVRDVRNNIVKPLTSNASYATQFKTADVGKATVYLVYSKESLFLDLVENLRSHYAADAGAATVFLWIDLFSLNLHDAVPPDNESLELMLKPAIGTIGKTAIYFASLQSPTVLSRLWCLFEVFASAELKNKLDLIVPANDKSAIVESITTNSPLISQLLQHLDSEKADASDATEKALIQENITSNIGYANLDAVIGEYLRQWFIDLARDLLSKENASNALNLIRSSLANLLGAQGQMEEAESLLVQVMEATIHESGGESEQAIVAMQDLAALYSSAGNFEAAEPLLEKTLKLRETKTKEQQEQNNNVDTWTTYRNLAMVYESQGKYAEAEEYFQKSYEGLKQTLAKNELTDVSLLHELMSDLGHIFQLQQKFDEAETILQQVLQELKASVGEDHPDYCRNLYLLGMNYKAANKSLQAEQKLNECLATRIAKLGQEHPDTILTLTSLCEVLESVGKYDVANKHYSVMVENLSLMYELNNEYENAKTLFQDAYLSRKVAVGDTHVETLRALECLSLYHEVIHQYSKAREHLQQCYDSTVLTLGENDVQTLTILNHLGLLYQYENDLDKAQEVFIQCYEARKRVIGETNIDTLATCANLSTVYCLQSNYVKAEPLCAQCLDQRRTVLGDKHVDTLSTYMTMAQIYKGLNKYDRAEINYLLCVEGRIAVLGDNHTDTLKAINGLGSLYCSQGRNNKAEPLYLQCLDRARLRFGDEHPETIAATSSLAGLYCTQGKYSKAEPLYKKCLEVTKSRLGEDNAETISCVNNLAGLYRSLGKYDKAEELYLGSYELLKTKLGDSHSNTLVALNSLAGLYYRQGKYDKAGPLYLQCWGLRKQTLGSDHTDTLISLNNLAFLYRVESRFAEAEPLYEECLMRRRNKLGENHPDTQSTLTNLVSLYRSQGKNAKADELMAKK